ncbi:TetR/AcrR family transcriptional regulator [Streptomyces gobitricini]|uniref:HTH tetR-type domain-containing protein n=1 Tax=Streptomyces gobitricini TaxID=68211 RepID=A0ABN3NCK9_9ACTN
MPPPPPLRRTPVQQRSAERLARILDACAELIEEAGYDELSTRGVAVRAGVPIGSVYRFFSGKRDMAAALAHRNLDRYAERVAARLAERPDLDAYGAVDSVLDEYIAMKRTVPGFGLVDFGVPGAPEGPDGVPGQAGPASGGPGRDGPGPDPRPAGPGPGPGTGTDPGRDGAGRAGSGSGGSGRHVNHLVADRIRGLLAGHLVHPSGDVPRRKVLVAVEAADALLRLAFRGGPPGDPELIAETRVLLHAYLAPVLRD